MSAREALLGERTPYGYTHREAIKALQEREASQRYLNTVTEWGRESRAAIPQCAVCPAPYKGSAKGYPLCQRHLDRLKEVRATRKTRRLAAEEEQQREWRALRISRRIEREEIRALKRQARVEWDAAHPRIPRYSGPPRRGFVYRLYDAEGRLLYVGKTWNVTQRLLNGPTAHARTKEWWPEVCEAKIAVYSREDTALRAEAWAIKAECPLYNVIRPEPSTKRPPKPLHVYEGALA